MKGAKSKSKSKKPDSRLAVKKKEAPAKKTKEVKDPNKPKRPASAFFVFMEDFRKQYKEKHPNNKSVSVVGKAGGDKWKSLTAAEKAPYVAKAEKRKSDYDINLQAYNKKLKNRWQSGCSDADIMNKAQREYRTTYDKKGFNLVDAWKELKDRPKWQGISLMGEEFEDDQPNPSKKSKGSESGNDGSNDPLNFQFNQNEEPPSGSKLKQRWKKPVGGSSSKGESLTEVVSQYKASKDEEREEKLKIMKEQADRRNERELMALKVLEMQKNLIEKDTEARDWETYIKPHDNLHPALLDHVIRKKRELAEKYGWPVYF